MKSILEDDNLWFDIEHRVCEDCEHNECFGQAPNPLAIQTDYCSCSHHRITHNRRDGSCSKIGCLCLKFE